VVEVLEKMVMVIDQEVLEALEVIEHLIIVKLLVVEVLLKQL
jgi:hypothetical protein